MHVSQKSQSQSENIFESKNDFGFSSSASRAKNASSLCNIQTELITGRSSVRVGSTSSDEKVPLDCSSGGTSTKRSNIAKSASHLPGAKMHRSPKSMVKASMEQSCSDMERKGQSTDESSRSCGSFYYFKLYFFIFLLSCSCDAEFGILRDTTPPQGGNGSSSMGLMKKIGLMRSSKIERLECADDTGNRHKKIKVSELQNFP